MLLHAPHPPPTHLENLMHPGHDGLRGLPLPLPLPLPLRHPRALHGGALLLRLLLLHLLLHNLTDLVQQVVEELVRVLPGQGGGGRA